MQAIEIISMQMPVYKLSQKFIAQTTFLINFQTPPLFTPFPKFVLGTFALIFDKQNVSPIMKVLHLVSFKTLSSSLKHASRTNCYEFPRTNSAM